MIIPWIITASSEDPTDNLSASGANSASDRSVMDSSKFSFVSVAPITVLTSSKFWVIQRAINSLMAPADTFDSAFPAIERDDNELIVIEKKDLQAASTTRSMHKSQSTYPPNRSWSHPYLHRYRLRFCHSTANKGRIFILLL